jgi:hypothetical protein
LRELQLGPVDVRLAVSVGFHHGPMTAEETNQPAKHRLGILLRRLAGAPAFS